ncbi:MAG: DUF3108 domain-containing protein [Alphaproteobacteria bacterium]|nr:DUF3108 domain-containing protein [Alphaproteobacteria bacterium]
MIPRIHHILLIYVVLTGLFASPARAQAGVQTMTYDVYAGGIRVVEAQLTVDESEKGRYSLVLSAKTLGVLAVFVPWTGSFESKGWVTPDGSFRPEQHKSTGKTRKEEEIKTYSYDKEKGFTGLVIKETGKKPEKKEPSKELTEGTTDALSATLTVMDAVAQGKKCGGSSEVYDGDRRFRQIFTNKGTKDLEATRYNVFKGVAAECTVEIEPLAGKWHKKPRGWLSIQEQGRAQGTMPTVWMAKMNEAGPAVPVKVQVKTAYGTFIMQLSHYKNGDQVLVAEKK